jgi:hypothetical protein
MEYNSGRPKMIIAEYGRHIQKMINHATSIENKEERNHCAKSIIKVMGELNPHLRDVADFNHKLWDHLFIMSNFLLDVDSPYDKPSPEKLNEKPDPLAYPEANVKYRHYGKIVRQLIAKAQEYEAGKEKDALVSSIANLLKKTYITWNNDSVTDEIILGDLKKLSDDKLTVPENFEFENTIEIVARNQKRRKRPSNNNQRQHNRGRKKN